MCGYAWGENIGWINFNDPSVPYKVQTSWIPPFENCGEELIVDDFEDANPGSSVTVTDEDVDGILEEGETFEIEVVMPTTDTCTVANITGAEINTAESPPTIGAHDESVIAQAEIDAAVAALEDLTGYTGEVESINIVSLDSSPIIWGPMIMTCS